MQVIRGWEWEVFFGELNFSSDGYDMILGTGYVSSLSGLYVRVWHNNQFIFGTWISALKLNEYYTPEKFSLSNEVWNKIIEYAETMEKMNLFS